MKKFVIQDKQTGTLIDEFTTYEQAQNQLEEYEEQDRQEGIYEADFYEIAEREI